MVYKILHCLACMDRGGAETFIMNVYRAIDRNKYNFDFLLHYDKGSYCNEIRKFGGHIYTIPSRSQGLFKYRHSLKLFFSEHQGEYNAIHVHTSSLSSLDVLNYAKQYGVKIRIIHSHSTAQDGLVHNLLHWFHKPFVSRLATNYLACSEDAGRWLYAYTGVLNKYVVIKNGIDVEKFKFRDVYRKEIRERYGIDSKALVLGHVGRFEAVKNHKFLIDIFDKYQEAHPRVYLLLIGIGTLMNETKELVASKGLSDKVIFAGLQTDIYKYLSAFDYFIFPSVFEGLPVALVEAQCSGVTTVCSDRVSPEAKLTNCICFYPLENSPKQWADFIGSLEIKERLSNVNDIVRNGYSINETVNYLTSHIYI